MRASAAVGDVSSLLLLLARAAVALLGYGYIHPDEWHQSGEFLAWRYASVPTALSWEFQVDAACRSVASISLFGLPVIAANWLWAALQYGAPSARSFFLLQRATSLGYSLLNDALFSRLLTGASRSQRRTVRLLLLSSPANLVWMVRPFTNAIEALLLTASFCCLHALHGADERPHAEGRADAQARTAASAALGAIFAAGFFSRFTFAICALPAGVHFLRLCFARRPLAHGAARMALPAAAAFACTALAHVAFDTRHFNGGALAPPTVTPLNAFAYNVRPQNLALHGTHPRWRHALVGFPLLFGAPAALAVWAACARLAFGIGTPRLAVGPGAKQAPLDAMLKLSLWTIITTVALLSIAPHQEPRFLLALLTPVTLVFAAQLPQTGRWRRRLIFAHLIQSAVTTGIYGFAHQAGVTPALLSINEAVRAVQMGRPSSQTLVRAWPGDQLVSVHVWSWKLFMAPTHQLVPAPAIGALYPHGPSVEVTMYDPPGEALDALVPLIDRHVRADAERGRRQTHFVLAPSWDDMPRQRADNFTMQLVRTVRPHLDIDHVPQLISRWNRDRAEGRATWWPDPSIEMFRVTSTPCGLLEME